MSAFSDIDASNQQTARERRTANARHYVIPTDKYAPAFTTMIAALAWSKNSPEATNTITTCECGNFWSHDIGSVPTRDDFVVGKENLLRALSGGDAPSDAKAQRRCVKPPLGCGKLVRAFRDRLSEREYQITGFCQECQDAIEATADDE